MEKLSPEVQSICDLYASMNQDGELRAKNVLIELANPWKVVDTGLLIIEEWLNDNPVVSNEAMKKWSGGGIFGGFLGKKLN